MTNIIPTKSEVEQILKLKSEIFDLISQIDYINNLKNQKLKELDILELRFREGQYKDKEETV